MDINLTKEEVQKRVLKDGNPLDLDMFDWDEDSRTFKTYVGGLVIDFIDINNIKFKTGNDCMFKTGSGCVFKTGNDCTFDTDSDCTFNTGYECTFKTGPNCEFDTGSCCVFRTSSNCRFTTRSSCKFDTGDKCKFKTIDNCTFDTSNDCEFYTGPNCIFVTYGNCTFSVENNCVVINKLNNEVIKLVPNVKTSIYPSGIPGYLIGSDYYLNDTKQEDEYMIVNDILSKIISKKDNVFKVHNYSTRLSRFDKTPSYIVQDGDIFSHGDTVEEARESLIYKLSNRDKSVYVNLTIDSVLTKEEAIKMYRVITGACEYGVRDYVASLTNVKDSYTVREIIELTNGRYGNDVLRRFFKI